MYIGKDFEKLILSYNAPRETFKVQLQHEDGDDVCVEPIEHLNHC